MSVITRPEHFHADDVFIDLRATIGRQLFLKCEAFNFSGSIKLKAAAAMVEGAERSGRLRPDSILVESSSGNLGVALSMIAASRGYRFVCVTDSRCNPVTRQAMEALGASVEVITAADAETGLLGARIERVRSLCRMDQRYVWLNQYANEDAWRAHFDSTAPAILRAFPELDVLFVGAGTTGTLMGCARYLRRHRPQARIIAVDAVGSTTFGGPAAPRRIPGLGTSRRPELLDTSLVDEVIMVDEIDTIRACRTMASTGFLFGGSTGTVVSGASRWLTDHDHPSLRAVAIAPDLGERYLTTVYDDDWVRSAYGTGVLDDDRANPTAFSSAVGDYQSQPPSLSGRENGRLTSTVPL